MKNKKIAVIGSGISGLAFAYIAKHNNLDIALFESNNYFGGHSNTIDINEGNSIFPVDTGFLVHNKITYPNLIQLFEQLGIEIVDSDMSLSIKIEDLDLEWGGTNLNTVFAQRKNILNFKFHAFLLEILDFNKRSTFFLEWSKNNPNATLGELLKEFKYSENLANWYIIPMAAAIWSTPANKILDFPAYTFITFCINHHLLQVNDRPKWRTIKNGSRTYVNKIIENIDRKYLNTEIEKVIFENNKVKVYFNNTFEEFDYVIMATHADQTNKILKNKTVEQENVLKHFKYEENIAYVHSDESFLPKKKFIWSAWNYVSSPKAHKVSVSYYINKLQPLPTKKPIIVTLNPHKEVNPNYIHKIINYTHPIFDKNAIAAQSRIESIQGVNNIFLCGAWGGYGFHEDGIKSAVKAALKMNLEIPWKWELP